MDASSFKTLMSRVPAPVTVVTTRDGEQPAGATVSSFASLSLDPPLISIALIAAPRCSRRSARPSASPSTCSRMTRPRLRFLRGAGGDALFQRELDLARWSAAPAWGRQLRRLRRLAGGGRRRSCATLRPGS